MAVLLARLGYAQDAPKPWSITIEQAWTSQHGYSGVIERYTWTTINYQISPKWLAVGGFNANRRNGSFDENYLEYDNGFRFRIGRISPNFGFSTWTDLYYTPFISMPMFRATSYDGRFGLFRYGSGMDVQFGGPQYQAVIGAFDTTLNDQQLEPHRLGHVFGRVETPIGNLILGLNAAIQAKNDGEGQRNWYLADVRWTVPRIQFLGESYYGEANQTKFKGVTGSVIFRPPHLSRTQLALRADEFNMSTNGVNRHRRLYTGAIRQIISPMLTASLNYAWGDPDEILDRNRGWSFQLMATVRF